MKIHFVIQKLAGIRGGAERITVETAAAMAARGHDVTIATFEPRNGPPAYDPDGVRVINLFPGFSASGAGRPVAAQGSARPGTGRRLETMLKRLPNVSPLAEAKFALTHGLFCRRLHRFLRHDRADVIVAVMRPAITAAAFAADATGTPVVASTHNVPAADYEASDRWDQNPVYRRRSIEAFDRCASILVLLEEFRDWFPARLRERVSVVPNPVAALGPVADADQAEARKVILGVGRLTAVKRFDLLLSAWRRIAHAHPGWSVEIVGAGPEEASLRQQIDAAGAGFPARLRGVTADVARFYESAAILCHPAAYEGFGLVVGEALAQGVPVVGFADCPGVNMLVRDGENGLLVPPGSDRAANLAEALGRLLGDPSLRTRLAAAAPASVARFAPSIVYDQWEEILRRTAGSV